MDENEDADDDGGLFNSPAAGSLLMAQHSDNNEDGDGMGMGMAIGICGDDAGSHLLLSCNVFSGGSRGGSGTEALPLRGSSVDFHINKWPRLPLQHLPVETARDRDGAELFIGRRALNKIMVHADYASAETCLPRHWGLRGIDRRTRPRLLWPCCRTQANRGQNRQQQHRHRQQEYVKWTYQNGDDAAS